MQLTTTNPIPNIPIDECIFTGFLYDMTACGGAEGRGDVDRSGLLWKFWPKLSCILHTGMGHAFIEHKKRHRICRSHGQTEKFPQSAYAWYELGWGMSLGAIGHRTMRWPTSSPLWGGQGFTSNTFRANPFFFFWSDFQTLNNSHRLLRRPPKGNGMRARKIGYKYDMPFTMSHSRFDLVRTDMCLYLSVCECEFVFFFFFASLFCIVCIIKAFCPAICFSSHRNGKKYYFDEMGGPPNVRYTVIHWFGCPQLDIHSLASTHPK